MSSRPPMETPGLVYYDHFVGRTLCIVDERHQIEGPGRPMALVKAAARFYLQNPYPASEAALRQPPPPIGHNQVSLLPAQLQRVMLGFVASVCHRLAAQPAKLKLHNGDAWRRRKFILARVLAGYTARIQRTVVDYRKAAHARISKYVCTHVRVCERDPAQFRDRIIANLPLVNVRDISLNSESPSCHFCRDYYGCHTLLVHAVRQGHLNVCRYLVELGADVNAVCKDGYTALFHAIAFNFFDVLRFLVGAGADVSAYCCPAYAPLSMAALSGRLDMCRYLLDLGVDVNEAVESMPALHWAANRAQETCVDLCRLLVQRGAHVNARDGEGSTALHMSAQHLYTRNNVECCRFLVEAGADVKAEDDERRTVLHIAAQYRQVEVCRYLIDIGLDVNAKSRHGTPLHLFLTQASGVDLKNGIAQLLLECGADVRAVDDEGCTALHAACSNNIPARHRFLVEAGSDINAVSHDGCTALHLAAKKGHLETVQYLVEAGADVKATDSSGATVFEYASKCVIYEWGRRIQSYLRNVGAPVPEKFRNQ